MFKNANAQAPVGWLAVRWGLGGGAVVVHEVLAQAVNCVARVSWAIDEVLACKGIEGEFTEQIPQVLSHDVQGRDPDCSMRPGVGGDYG